MIDKGKKPLLGVGIDAVDYEAAVGRIVSAAQQGEPLATSATAVHGLMEAATNPEHRYRMNQLELVVPDGQPVRWGLNLVHGTGLRDRVYGPNLMLETCRAAAEHGLGIFLFGGTAELLADLQTNLSQQFPSLQIIEARPSAFRTLSQDEHDQLLSDIANSGASILMVGLGCPRQEIWAYEAKDVVRMPILAVGAAFNFHAGVLDQAPPILQRFGLEWAYRLYKEPKRLWRRYLYLNPYYLLLLAAQKLRLAKGWFADPGTPPATQVRYG